MSPVSTLIGGVSELYQGDLDLGRIAVQRLEADELGPSVLVEDFHYGAVAVVQRLQEARPDALVLIGAIARGRAPGTVERRRVGRMNLASEELQSAVGDAVTGYVDIDLVIKVGAAFEALPRRVVTIEVEPERLEPSEALSESAVRALEHVVDLARAESRRTAAMVVADEVRASMERDELEPSPAVDAMMELVAELERADLSGRWGSTFALRDRVRLAISEGRTGEGMTGLDWGLWWGLIEELDRVQGLEAPTT